MIAMMTSIPRTDRQDTAIMYHSGRNRNRKKVKGFPKAPDLNLFHIATQCKVFAGLNKTRYNVN